VYGSYAAIDCGLLTESLVCLTGGVPMRIPISPSADPDDGTLFDNLLRIQDERGVCLLGAGSAGQPTRAAVDAAIAVGGSGGFSKDEYPLGICPGHAYAVLGLFDLDARQRRSPASWQLLQLRNPYGMPRARSRCRFAPLLIHKFHTRFANIFGASTSEATMRPDPRYATQGVRRWRRAVGGRFFCVEGSTLPPRNTDPQELFLGPNKYLLL
jgi:hypothetical protein